MNKYETYNGVLGPVTCLKDLEGRILSNVKFDDDEIRLYLTENHYVIMYHGQDCCESVYVDDVNGDIQDLVGTPILLAEEVSSSDVGFQESKHEHRYESVTWTFYRFRTIKGSVDVRWCGTSNGYYSEGVDVEVVTK